MHHFNYKNNQLFAEEVDLAKIAQVVGTPFYCYSTATLKHHVNVLNEAFKTVNLDNRIHFAVKANPNKAILSILASLGCSADAVSEGEIRLALAAGIPASKIIFSGVGKTQSEIMFALENNLASINVESFAELKNISEISEKTGLQANIALRLNPDIQTGNHAKIATGHGASKFGIPIDEVQQYVSWINSHKRLKLVSLSMHIGSQITNTKPFNGAFAKLADAVDSVIASGNKLEFIDIGGGLGVPYDNSIAAPPLPKIYAEVAAAHFKRFNLPLALEPGRLIAANAGILAGSVIYRKLSNEKQFLITDVGMNDLIRPTLYEAWHDIIPFITSNAEGTAVNTEIVDVVGPVCETGDYIALDRNLPVLNQNDKFAILGAGAYGSAMANEYNSRPRIAEVLVEGDRFAVIRKRRTYAQMLAEHPDPTWQNS